MSKRPDERSDNLVEGASAPERALSAPERALSAPERALSAPERALSAPERANAERAPLHSPGCDRGAACDHHSHIADAPSGTRLPCIVVVDDDADLCVGVSISLGPSCETHCVAPSDAVELLRSLPALDVALVDCDPPPSVQAPIFRELASWPSAICVLMSANAQKVEQLRALGVFAPLVLDKPLHREALEAIRSATLELCQTLG